ncbi:methyl-accepting chemotaxis protein (plasmid) [Azospirillum sp. B510]|uniref:MFS transporter n=1 Tax=Azospirillum sp. (strain B510) TaxID=137722 RepID=UPI0001C4B8E3|nr:MFS transporter [Azospirillum sp. B510]BAI73683.1 methyl-accepting chemotaxis protein [Azospirillum sp. B510]
MELTFIKRLNWLLTGLVSVLMLVSLVVQTSHFNTLFRPQAEPELARKAEVVGSYIVAQIDRAVSLGFEVEKLTGVDEILADALAVNPDVNYIALMVGDRIAAFAGAPDARSGDTLAARDADGAVARRYIDAALAVGGGGVPALLHVGVPAGSVEAALNDMVFDLGSVLIVAILLNIEILLLVVGSSVTAPLQWMGDVLQEAAEGRLNLRTGLRGRDEVGHLGRAMDRALDAACSTAETAPYLRDDGAEASAAGGRITTMQRIGELRFAVFVFSLAEELTRTFLSVYIKDLFEPVPGLGKELVIGAPIALFMLIWALAQPVAGNVSERRGRRTVFLIGASLSALGLLGSGLATDLIQLILARCVTAVGYASVFISAQGFVIDATDPRRRAGAIALYAGGILTAGVCGPAIGGVIADQVGFRMTFIVSAMLAVAAALMAWRVLPKHAGAGGKARTRGLTPRDFGMCLANPRFVAVTLFSAVPAKFGLTALLFFLLPLALDDNGVSQSWIGRVLLLYWLMMIVVSPLVAHLSDRSGRRTPFLAIGGVTAAGSAYVLSISGTLPLTITGVALLGLAHALVNTPQMALLAESCVRERSTLGETTVIGMFRLIERLGSVVAPFLAGLFLAHYGYHGAMKGIGIVLAACVVVQLLLTTTFGGRPSAALSRKDPA